MSTNTVPQGYTLTEGRSAEMYPGVPDIKDYPIIRATTSDGRFVGEAFKRLDGSGWYVIIPSCVAWTDISECTLRKKHARAILTLAAELYARVPA